MSALLVMKNTLTNIRVSSESREVLGIGCYWLLLDVTRCYWKLLGVNVTKCYLESVNVS